MSTESPAEVSSKGPSLGVPAPIHRPLQKRAMSTKPSPERSSAPTAASRWQQAATSAPAIRNKRISDAVRASYMRPSSISFDAFDDVVTAAQILYDIAKSLSETHHAPAEYDYIVEDLGDMASMMAQLHSVISSSGFLDANYRLTQVLLTRIGECYLRVREGLSRVAKIVSLGIEPEPGSASIGRVLNLHWRGYPKMGWHIWHGDDVVKFREEMQIALQRLQIMVTFSNRFVAILPLLGQGSNVNRQLCDR